jgi:RHS repeat-associated protein
VTSFDYGGVSRVDRTVSVQGSSGPTNVTVREIYDRFGRLRRVDEPVGSGNSWLYDYDEGDRLVKVTASAPGLPTQTRTFDYDGRGFLTKECHPEKGPPGSVNACVTYDTLDARGHAGRSLIGGRTLDFTYDKAERLLSVTAVGAGHLLKALTYDDGATGTASRLDGRLHTATRHNWVNLPWDNIGADVDVEVTESYAYDGVGGRVSDRTTDLVRPSPYGTSTFSQAFTWTPLGDPDVMDYPTCTGVACPSGKTDFQVDHGYEAGYLTSIVSSTGQNWIEEIRYHPNGLWSEIDHRNNWTDRQTIASHGMQRPLELSAENGLGQEQYTTGTFAYDGAGNVKAMGADSFTYDAHNRLASARIDGDDYSYAYDAYGNLTSQTWAAGTPVTTVSICIDSQKNRIAETPSGGCMLIADQDYHGNLVELQGFEHQYDALDMPIHRNPAPTPPDHTYVYTADDERLWFINAGGGPPPADGGSGTAWEGLFLRDLDGKLLRQYSKEDARPFVPPDSVYTAPFTVSRDSIHRHGQLAVIQSGSVIRHQHLDHLGTPRAISAGSGALVSTHKYTPYGKELGGSSGNAQQFTGHERDSHGAGEDDNLDYMHARFYSPYVGRFLSSDKAAVWKPQAPQTWNRNAYALDSPIRYMDPEGTEPIDPTLATFLGDYFGHDVSHLRVFGGPFSRFITRLFGAEAVTFGQRILFGKGHWELYEAKDRIGVALAGHEVRHTLQYADKGRLAFLIQYAAQAIKARGVPQDMPLERIAYRDEAILLDLLRDEELLRSIQNGTFSPGRSLGSISISIAPSTTGWHTSLVPFLPASIYDAFAAGLVCIEGVCAGG